MAHAKILKWSVISPIIVVRFLIYHIYVFFLLKTNHKNKYSTLRKCKKNSESAYICFNSYRLDFCYFMTPFICQRFKGIFGDIQLYYENKKIEEYIMYILTKDIEN